MGTLLTKPMSDITYEDVESFCDPTNGPSESQTLEYKSAGEILDTKNVAKAASALANTFGGTLILGVDDDHKTARPEKVSGIPWVRDQELQISSILMDNITPPLVPPPEIRVVSLPHDPSKVVVVIRVSQSNATPHGACDKNGDQHFYVRVGSQSRPAGDWEASATREKLEWLFSRRRRSEELRDRVLAEALDRIEIYYERGLFPHFVDGKRPMGQGVFSVLPLYPQDPVATVQELYNKCVDLGTNKDQKLVVKSKYDAGDFPSYGLMTPTNTQNGVIGFYEYSESAVRLFEFNIFGLFLYQQTFARALPELGPETRNLDFVVLCRQLDSYLQLASRFYDTIKSVGLLRLHVSILNLDGLCMLPPRSDGLPLAFGADPRGFVSYQREIDCDRVVQADLLRDSDQRNALLLSLLSEIGSAFNWDASRVQQEFDHYGPTYATPAQEK
jgi:hypothetical protein